MNIHAVSHSLPHRGPGAPRTRTRWQPYASSLTLSCVPRSPSVHLHTPASSVSSVSPQSIHLPPILDNEHLKACLQPPPIASTVRENFRAKYAARLVDQAVKTLSETWHPDEIPTVFTASSREALCAQPELSSPPPISTNFPTLFVGGNTQLPSPVTPTSRPTPIPTGNESYVQAPEGSVGCNLIPIKGFVHEVLRRSRTSTGVLQTALCYLEAVRPKVPELLRKEKLRPTCQCPPSEEHLEPRIIQGVFDLSLPSDVPDNTVETVRLSDTVLVVDIDSDDVPPPPPVSASRVQDESSLPPLPLLPNPLCCPRRTFLACLILASKFMQDRSYSNRAWAKLAGLPPREIGRCERAVGEALEWRLWVGKLPPSAITSGSSSSRIVGRTRSDGDVLGGTIPTCTPSSTAAWASASAAPVTSSYSPPTPSPPVLAPRLKTRGVSRSATLPVTNTARSSTLVDPFFIPISGATGIYYESRETSRSDCEHTSHMDVVPQFEISPPLSTPTLIYSPMSSASSSSDGSEDRSMSMSTFMDTSTPAMSANLGPWVANVSNYTQSDPANPCGSHGSILPFGTNPTYMVDMDISEAANRLLPNINSNLSGLKQFRPVLPSFAEMFSNSGSLGNGIH